MALTVSLDTVLTRLNEAIHAFNLLELRVQELEARFDSALELHGLDLAANEDLIRRQDSGEEDLVG